MSGSTAVSSLQAEAMDMATSITAPRLEISRPEKSRPPTCTPLVLDYAYDLPWLQIINSTNIGIAIMQGLSGSFGVILSVPATVAIATVLYTLPARSRAAAGPEA